MNLQSKLREVLQDLLRNYYIDVDDEYFTSNFGEEEITKIIQAFKDEGWAPPLESHDDDMWPEVKK